MARGGEEAGGSQNRQGYAEQLANQGEYTIRNQRYAIAETLLREVHGDPSEKAARDFQDVLCPILTR